MLLINIILLLNGLDELERKELEAQAYECAMASEKSDGAICKCYTDRGLEAPL